MNACARVETPRRPKGGVYYCARNDGVAMPSLQADSIKISKKLLRNLLKLLLTFCFLNANNVIINLLRPRAPREPHSSRPTPRSAR